MAHALAAPIAAIPRDVPPRRAPDDALVRGSLVASWRVLGELGRGGMASVHAVIHTKFGSSAAIKIAHRSILGPRLTPVTFLREARIIRAIDHPAVVEMYATGSFGDRPYLVMERLRGRSLGRRVDAGPPLPRVEAIDILLELCDVLRAAHAVGIVHRDVKLDNVFLLAGGSRRLKLLDWGVAHVAGEDDPFRGLIAGTLTYVAPEQIRGDALTPAADVYSLAVLAFHLLCGRPPFASPNELVLVDMHLRADPPRPSSAWTAIPAALEAALLAMLAKSPVDRPSLDAVELALRDARETITAGSWAPRWLRARAGAPPIISDVFGRPALPVPAFRAPWIGVAIGIAAIAGLLHELP